MGSESFFFTLFYHYICFTQRGFYIVIYVLLKEDFAQNELSGNFIITFFNIFFPSVGLLEFFYGSFQQWVGVFLAVFFPSTSFRI